MSSDSLRLVGTMVLLARAIDQEARRNQRLQDLNLNDLFVLRTIQLGQTLPSQIAKRLRLDPPRITRIVDELVARGLIERRDDPEDRRRTRLGITKAGARVLEVGLEEIALSTDELLARMKPTDREKLEGGLDAAREALDQSAKGE